MANKFYEIGKASGEKVIDYSKAFDKTLETLYKQMNDSKDKLDAFMINSPQGISMDKVPEQARGYVTRFLADGKQRYAQAAAVLSSGISSTSEQYMDAVEIMNQVQNSFENLGNQFATYNANVAKEKLRAKDIAAGARPWEITDFNNYITGDIFKDGKVDKNGTILYNSSNPLHTEQQQFSQYATVGMSTDRAAESFSAINTNVMAHKRNGDSWELINGQLEKDYNAVIHGLEKLDPSHGVRDLVFSDYEYMQTLINIDRAVDLEAYEKELMRWKGDDKLSKQAIDGYKQHNMDAWLDIYTLTTGPSPEGEEGKFIDGFTYSSDDIGGYSAEMKSTNRLQIDNRATYGDYFGRRATYKYNSSNDNYTVEVPPVMSSDGGSVIVEGYTRTLEPWEVLKEEGLLKRNETDPSKYDKASSDTNTEVAPEPLFDVESIVSNINQDIFMQKARDAANQLEAIFVNIPGFKVRSTERGGVIITYNNKRVEVPAGIIYNTTDNEKKQAIAKSKDTLIKWLQTVAIKPIVN